MYVDIQIKKQHKRKSIHYVSNPFVLHNSGKQNAAGFENHN